MAHIQRFAYTLVLLKTCFVRNSFSNLKTIVYSETIKDSSNLPYFSYLIHSVTASEIGNDKTINLALLNKI